jgi:ring-1,2-phenylacetyl-CoA epoxidase subunit PaaB
VAQEMAVYEVFGQERKGEPHRHAGSLLAADGDMALLLAQELFCRRKEYVQIWVVPRTAIREATEGEAPLGPDPRRSYRSGEGYRETVQKWKRFGGEGHADRA